MKRIDKQTWWPELIELKDSLSLRELSERFGASPAAIANALKRNGIKRKAAQAGPRKAKKTESKPKPKKRPGRPSVLDDFQHKMGTLVDREIAEMAGVTVSAVTNYRRRHNIKASTSRGRPRKPTVSGANLVSSRRSVSRGYRVVIKGEAFVVIAKDIAEAAAKARAAGRGEVTQIELLGRALG